MSLSTLVPWSLALLLATPATSPYVPSVLTVSTDLAQKQPDIAQPSQNNQPSLPDGPKAPPNPNADGIYRIGNGVSAPKLIYSVEPSFSEKARKMKIAGNCKVSVIVDQEGHPKDIHVVNSIADNVPAKQRAGALELDDEAIKAVSQYRFEPATFKGKPVLVELNIEVNFQIF